MRFIVAKIAEAGDVLALQSGRWLGCHSQLFKDGDAAKNVYGKREKG
jgi:hypothetical protein